MKKKKVIALTWGGTWGHIFPLLSAYNYLKEDGDFDFIWVGEEGGLEEEIATKNKIPFFTIPAGKIRRYWDVRNFYEPLKNLTGICFWIYYILKYKIDIVFSKWGYVSLPLCIAGFLLRKKIYIHESDMKSGIANQLIGLIATKKFYTFTNKNIDEKRNILAWQILNPELLDNLENLQLQQNPRLEVLVIAGSQGSRTIFEALLKVLPDLPHINFNIILGEKNMHFKDYFKNFSNVVAHDFVTQKRLGKILKFTDIAITRWWATSLWELNVFGIHSIIVPLKNSAWNHQMKNAEYFNEVFKSDVLDEEKNLSLEFFRLLQKYRDLRKAWLNLDGFFKPLQIIEKHMNK